MTSFTRPLAAHVRPRPKILAAIDEASPGTEPETRYSSEDVDIRIYGDTAVIAFRLVGTPADTSLATEPDYYLNTGTFLRRDGEWRAVAWQATAIPKPE